MAALDKQPMVRMSMHRLLKDLGDLMIKINFEGVGRHSLGNLQQVRLQRHQQQQQQQQQQKQQQQAEKIPQLVFRTLQFLWRSLFNQIDIRVL